MPTPEKANSVMLVLATITAPAGRSRLPTVASRKAVCRVPQHQGAGRGEFAGDVEQILDGDDGAVERAERNAGAGARIGGVGHRARRLCVDGQTGARALACRIGDARKRGFETVAATGHCANPPLSTIKRAISSTPLPSRKFVMTKGR